MLMMDSHVLFINKIAIFSHIWNEFIWEIYAQWKTLAIDVWKDTDQQGDLERLFEYATCGGV